MPHRILVVDDHPLQGRVVARQLESLGHRAICASDADEAMLLFGAGRFDLALVARNARIDGDRLVRGMRDVERRLARAPCPVIACEGLSVRERSPDADAAFARFVALPIATVALDALLRDLLPVADPNAGEREDAAHWHLFERTSRVDLATARSALDEGRRDAVQASLHRMKGAALMLRRERLAAACARAEEAAEHAHADDVRAHIDTVERCLSARDGDAGAAAGADDQGASSR